MRTVGASRLAWLAILGVVVVLRLAALGAPALWGDEVLSATAQYLPPDRLIQELSRDDSQVAPFDPPGYHLLNRWTHVVSPDAAAAMFTVRGRFLLRLLSALAGALTVWGVVLLARRVFPPRWAWVPALLLAFNFYGIYYSQEVRPYALVGLVALVSTWLLWVILQEDRRRWWPVYGASLAALAYLHYAATLTAVVHFAAFAAIAALRLNLSAAPALPRRVGLPEVVGFGAALALAAALYAPWLPQLLHITSRPEHFHPEAAGGLVWGWRVTISAWAHFGGGGWGSLLVYGALAAAGWWAVWARQRAAAVLLAAFYVVPLTVLTAWPYSQFVHPRYLIFAQPVHVLLAGIGVVVLARRLARREAREKAVAAGLLALLFVGNALALGPYFRYGIKCSATVAGFADFCRAYIEPLF